jgi:cyclopropane-fatty-acyl-phospholipid synthase
MAGLDPSALSDRSLPGRPPAAARGAAPLSGPERRLVRRVIEARGGLPFELELWNGERFGESPERAAARVVVRDRATLLALALDPQSAFGDAYAHGRLEVVGDLVRFLELAFRARPREGRLAWAVAGLAARWLRPNTLRGSRANIRRHYDLGNDFYRLWLDQNLVYTCAYFPTPEASLEAAQLAKLEHVCRKLRLRPGERVVEVGCGWGALAIHMATRWGVRVRAFNISGEQVAWARERAKELGLVGRVEFVEDDYRNAAGRYDAFVSVGMLEHVGPGHYSELGRVIHRCLGPDGRGFLHSIGRARAQAFHPWIERNIFPGAHAPTLGEMVRILEPHDLVVLDAENLRLHYARTLEHWLARFERHTDEVQRRFGEVFARTWRLYLAGSVAAFRSGSLQLFQVLFARTATNEIPWTRADLYAER